MSSCKCNIDEVNIILDNLYEKVTFKELSNYNAFEYLYLYINLLKYVS